MNKFSTEEIITYDYYIKRLFEINIECNHENYYSEVIVPFLRSCCIEDTKIVPIYNDRATGKKTDIETPLQARMNTICAAKDEGGYVVPDYIFVPQKYSFENPLRPLIMVESKAPIIKNKDSYRDLKSLIGKYQEELKAEIKACKKGYVIFTDGFTWMFLQLKDDEIVESNNYNTIRFLNLGERNRLVYKFTVKQKTKSKNVVFEAPKEWNELKKTIRSVLQEIAK